MRRHPPAPFSPPHPGPGRTRQGQGPRSRRHTRLLGVLAFAAIGACHQARAQTFTGSLDNAGTIDTASAVFSLVNGGMTLQVVLSNTSTYSSYTNPNVLSGLFFSIASNPNLTPSSATASNMVNNTGCSVNCNIGSGFGYVYSAAGFIPPSGTGTVPISGQYGIASSGYSSLAPTFGSAATFSGGSGGLDGLGDSIVGPGYTSGSGTAGSNPLAEGSVTFDFNLPTPVTSLSISNVTFAYGTGPDGLNQVPEPAGLACFATATAALGIARRRGRRAPKH
jgi:hypothetical protein